MDVTPYIDEKPAPTLLFDRIPDRADVVRFMRPKDGGGWSPVTWSDFGRDIRRVTLWLNDGRLYRTDAAAVFASNSVEWLSAAMAIQAAGGTLVPVPADAAAERAAHIIEHSESRALFIGGTAELTKLLGVWRHLGGVGPIIAIGEVDIDEALAAADAFPGADGVPDADGLRDRIILWADAIEEGRSLIEADPAAFSQLLRQVTLQDRALMLYTSGRDGRRGGPARGVPLTHGSLAANARDWLIVNAPLLDERGADLLWLPFSHIFGLGEACLGNNLNYTSFLCQPEQVVDRLAEVKPTVLMSFPPLWEQLAARAKEEASPEAQRAKLGQLTGGRLKFCMSGGAGLQPSTKEFFLLKGLFLVDGYGLLEGSPTLTLNRHDAFDFESVGKPLPSVELRVAADGEIQARGPNVFAGYWKDDAATAEVFTEDGWLRTGDFGELNADGFLLLAGSVEPAAQPEPSVPVPIAVEAEQAAAEHAPSEPEAQLVAAQPPDLHRVPRRDTLDGFPSIEAVVDAANRAPAEEIEQRFADDPWLQQVVVYGDDKPYLVAGVWLDPERVAWWNEIDSASPAARATVIDALVEARVKKVNAELEPHDAIRRFVVLDGERDRDAHQERFEALYS